VGLEVQYRHVVGGLYRTLLIEVRTLTIFLMFKPERGTLKGFGSRRLGFSGMFLSRDAFSIIAKTMRVESLWVSYHPSTPFSKCRVFRLQ